MQKQLIWPQDNSRVAAARCVDTAARVQGARFAVCATRRGRGGGPLRVLSVFQWKICVRFVQGTYHVSLLWAIKVMVIWSYGGLNQLKMKWSL